MLLSAVVALALFAAQPGPGESSVASAPRAARLLAQAPMVGGSLDQMTHRALRTRELTTYRRALEAQLYPTRAGTGFIGIGAAAMGVGIGWGFYGWGYLSNNSWRWSEVAVLASAGASLLSGVAMLILGIVMRNQIDEHNAAVDKRINEVADELERLEHREGEPEAAPPGLPPGAPVPVI